MSQWSVFFLLSIGILLFASTAHATYPPSFSDCLMGDGDEYDQLDACQQLIRSNKRNHKLYVALGKTLDERRKRSQAVEFYKKSLSVFPNDKYFLKQLSIAQSHLPGQQDLPAKEKEVISKSSTAEKLNNIPSNQGKKSTTASLPKSSVQAKISKQAKNSTKRLKPAQQKIVIRDKKTPKTTNNIRLSSKQQLFVKQLELLQSLKQQGLISQTEFVARKNELLDVTFRVSRTTTKPGQPPKKSKVDLSHLNFGNYYALIIGNNRYKNLNNLETSVNDAQTLADVLKQQYGFKVKLLLNASRYETLKAMGEYRNTLKKEDNLLIYYAGHGVLDKASERGYWLPVDAELNYTANWISTSEITDTLKALKSWHVLVVADSCYSGTLVRSAAVTFTNNTEEKRTLMKRLLSKKSRTVITSGGLEPVIDSGGDNHSVFAAAFLDVLEDTETVIEAENVFSQIRDKVILNADQTPEYSNVRKVGHNGGDFIFLRK